MRSSLNKIAFQTTVEIFVGTFTYQIQTNNCSSETKDKMKVKKRNKKILQIA